MAGQRTATAVTGSYHQAIQCGQGCRLPDAADGLPSEQVVAEKCPFRNRFGSLVSVLTKDKSVSLIISHTYGINSGKFFLGTPVSTVIFINVSVVFQGGVRIVPGGCRPQRVCCQWRQYVTLVSLPN
ncbi:hypothetical protein DSECCO2_660270 [anaerobic digester metagenome]